MLLVKRPMFKCMHNYKTLLIRVMKFLLTRHFFIRATALLETTVDSLSTITQKSAKQNIVFCIVYKVICMQDIVYCSKKLQTEEGEGANINE
jgi:hypothetical protein